MNADVVFVDLEMQAMQCRMCKAQIEIPSRVIQNPDAMLEMKDGFRVMHQECQDAHRATVKLKFFSRPFPILRHTNGMPVPWQR